MTILSIICIFYYFLIKIHAETMYSTSVNTTFLGTKGLLPSFELLQSFNWVDKMNGINRDIYKDVTLTIEEANDGVIKDITIERIIYASNCKSTTCPLCNGHGKYSNFNIKHDTIIESPCPKCHGIGSIVPEGCNNYKEETEEIQIFIPAGILPGHELNFYNKGNVLPSGETGNFIFRILAIESPPIFSVIDGILTASLQLAPEEVLHGFEASIPYLDESILKIKRTTHITLPGTKSILTGVGLPEIPKDYNYMKYKEIKLKEVDNNVNNDKNDNNDSDSDECLFGFTGKIGSNNDNDVNKNKNSKIQNDIGTINKIDENDYDNEKDKINRGNLLLTFSLLPVEVDDHIGEDEIERLYYAYSSSSSSSFTSTDEDNDDNNDSNDTYDDMENIFVTLEEIEQFLSNINSSILSSSSTTTTTTTTTTSDEEIIDLDNDNNDNNNNHNYKKEENDIQLELFNGQRGGNDTLANQMLLAQVKAFAKMRRMRDAVYKRRKYARSIVGFLTDQMKFNNKDDKDNEN